ncbi:MAG: hypothetical protein M3547_01120 [Acidobacteriota bacterium]|nr:hypothetical protein [Acidobacteriota bacterium]
MELLAIFIVWVLVSVAAGNVAARKGLEKRKYVWLSLLLSPVVGLILAAAATPNQAKADEQQVASGLGRKCPYCAEVVKREATICRFCHKELPALEPLPVAPPAAESDAMAARFKTRADYEAWKATFKV